MQVFDVLLFVVFNCYLVLLGKWYNSRTIFSWCKKLDKAVQFRLNVELHKTCLRSFENFILLKIVLFK